MKKPIIVAESGADIPTNLVNQYGIYIVPMHVNMGGQTYDDSLNIQATDVIQYYQTHKDLPTTSAATPLDYDNIFKNIRQSFPDQDIVVVSNSAQTTGSFNAARIASEEFDNIYLVDTENVSIGQGAIVIEAAKFIAGKDQVTGSDVVAFVEELRQRVRFSFLPTTLEFLKAGGRVSNASYLVASFLHIFPSIDLKEGLLIAGKKYRGSFQKSYRRMIDDFFIRFNLIPASIVLVETAGLSQDDKDTITEILKSKGVPEIHWHAAGAVITSHGGPGAFGIVGIESH